MTDTTDAEVDEMVNPVVGEIVEQEELAEQLLAQAREQGVSLTGSGGLLSQFANDVPKTVSTDRARPGRAVVDDRRDRGAR